MRTITAQAPDGAEWRVRVAWQPRWRALARRFGAWRRKRRDGENHLTGAKGAVETVWDSSSDPGSLSALAVLLAVLTLLGLLFWWLLLPLLLLAVDTVVVIVLLLAAIPVRVLFRRPWKVEARRSTKRESKADTADVVGWRNALDLRDRAADRVRRGEPPFPAAARVG